MSVRRASAVAYAVAVLLALAGLVVTAASVKPLAGPFFMFQFAVVVGASLYGGLAPGLLTMVLSGVGFFFLFFAPTVEAYQAARLGSFALVSTFFAWLAARMRNAKADAEKARAAAEAAEGEARAIGAQEEWLVAVVSHDLRNPLSAIRVTSEHLLMNAPDGQAKRLSRIVTSAGRMQKIIQDLLDYARARHGAGLPVRREAAQLGDICRSTIEEIRTAQPDRTVLVEVTGDDSASLDPARVEQVVSNLVTNALKYGVAGTPVEVKVTEEGAAVRLDVTNQGAPIPQHVVPTLFDPFRPGDAAGSVGLGLFIVAEIARAHGGSVSVRSDGRGTTFTVVFPKRATDDGAPVIAA